MFVKVIFVLCHSVFQWPTCIMLSTVFFFFFFRKPLRFFFNTVLFQKLYVSLDNKSKWTCVPMESKGVFEPKGTDISRVTAEYFPEGLTRGWDEIRTVNLDYLFDSSSSLEIPSPWIYVVPWTRGTYIGSTGKRWWLFEFVHFRWFHIFILLARYSEIDSASMCR